VLSLPGVVLTDQNAASSYVRFLSVSEYEQIRFDWVYAEDWTDPDRITYFQKSSAKCAEVLVPNRVEPSYIEGAYVVDQAAKRSLREQGFRAPINIGQHLFFR
jgi:hypothetical protein